MNKLLVFSAAAAIAMQCFAMSFDEAKAAGDFTEMVKQVNTSNFMSLAPSINADLARAMYNASLEDLKSMTNTDMKAYAFKFRTLAKTAAICNYYGLADVVEAYLNELANAKHEVNAPVADLMRCIIKTNVASKWCIKYTIANGKTAYEFLTLNVTDPSIALAFYKKAAEKGYYALAAEVFKQPMLVSNPAHAVDAHVTPEWKSFISSTFTSQVFDALPTVNLYTGIRYFTEVDFLAVDAYCTDIVMKNMASFNLNILFPHLNNKNMSIARYSLQYAPTIEKKIWAAKYLDRVQLNKEAMASIFLTIMDEGTFSQALDAAFYLNDADKVINVFKTLKEATATADEINKFIAMLGTLKTGYREDDIKFVLKTINQKYTLKLYDDRDTWEPVISKVRALLDIY